MHDSSSRALPGDDLALVLDQEARWIAAAQADPAAFEPLYCSTGRAFITICAPALLTRKMLLT